MKFKPGSIFETKCKKDYSIFCKDEYYYCIIVDSTACCVLYETSKKEITKVSNICINDIIYDNLAFSNKEFTKYFYTENEMKLLKLKKLSSL